VLTLYTYFRSSAAFRVRCALNLKGIAYAPEIVWLPAEDQLSDAYRDLNPQGLVPTLIDGSLRLNQSLAIIEYIEETRGGPRLLPVDPPGRARVRSLALLIACEIHPVNNLRILKYLKRTLGHEQATIDAWYRHWIAEGLTNFEAELAHPATGRYCHGDTVTLADCCLVPQIFNAKRFMCPLDAYPVTMRVFDALMQLPAFDAAQPSKQPDAARAA
jgi:maleylacetoacetate isomerase